MKVVHGKSADELKASLDYIPGRENVRWVTLDMSDAYRNFARDFFPNARLVADKFHVLRLINPAIHRHLKALGLPKEALPMYRILKKNPLKLTPKWRWVLRTWLADKPALRELHAVNEATYRLYRTKGYDRPPRR